MQHNSLGARVTGLPFGYAEARVLDGRPFTICEWTVGRDGMVMALEWEWE